MDCEKHSYQLMFSIYSTKKSNGAWWEFHCRWCGDKQTVHSSKFWNMYPPYLVI